uniref:Peptidyl-tRNA hydrolase n=1 Tax=Cyanothece sp. (strain PCC 7425 / ATCC 29141) TaxID=395961 RepID=B8HR17_CYAP4
MAIPSGSPAVRPTLIVGLGNPGEKYYRTRHNIGFMVVDALADRWHISLSPHKRFQAEFGEGAVRGATVQLLKPTTYMNNSGQSVRAVLDWYKRSPQSVLVVYDDMDLPLGKLRLRLNGSAGGHNGMRSLIAHLGTQDFPRLRLGIGNPRQAGGEKDAIPHVLGKFSPAEGPIVAEVLELATKAIETSLRDGVEKAMNLYNARSVNTAANTETG